MISVIIPALNAEADLASTLTALVPAAVDGFIREVIVVDGGSKDRTRQIAGQAGATIVEQSAARAERRRSLRSRSSCEIRRGLSPV